MAQVKTYNALIASLNKNISIAIEHVAIKMVTQLKYYLIEDFYNMYDPAAYKRAGQLKNAPKFEMLARNMAKIFIDTNSMSYRGVNDDFVAQMASFGFDDSTHIFRPGVSWTDFIQWCDGNVPRLIKEELRKQGLEVK